jgi:hypothetical protein
MYNGMYNVPGFIPVKNITCLPDTMIATHPVLYASSHAVCFVAVSPGQLLAKGRAIRPKQEIGLAIPAGLIAIRRPGLSGRVRQN